MPQTGRGKHRSTADFAEGADDLRFYRSYPRDQRNQRLKNLGVWGSLLTTDYPDGTDQSADPIINHFYPYYISEDAVSLCTFLGIRLGNHLLALISTYSESVPISDHQWLKTPLLGHSVAAAPRWAIRGQPTPVSIRAYPWQKIPCRYGSSDVYIEALVPAPPV